MDDLPVPIRDLLAGHIHPSMLPKEPGRRVFSVFDGGQEQVSSVRPSLRLVVCKE